MNVFEKNFVGGLRPALLSPAAGRACEKPAKFSRGRLYRRINSSWAGNFRETQHLLSVVARKSSRITLPPRPPGNLRKLGAFSFRHERTMALVKKEGGAGAPHLGTRD